MGGLCESIDVGFFRMMDYLDIGNAIFAVITSILALFALGRLYSRNQNSKLTFCLLCVAVGNIVVAFETVALVFFYFQWTTATVVSSGGLKIYLVFVFCVVYEIQKMSLLLLIAIQRLLLWKKPITFINQTRRSMALQFISVFCGVHLAAPLCFTAYFNLNDNIQETNWDLLVLIEELASGLCAVISALAVALHIFVSINMGRTNDASREVTANKQSPVYFTNQQIPNAAIEEQIEQEEQTHSYAARNWSGAIRRLMIVVTIVTCLNGLENIVDLTLWAIVRFTPYTWSCPLELMWDFSHIIYYTQMWSLSVAFFIGCPSLLSELNFFPAMKKWFPVSKRASHVMLEAQNN